MHEIPYITADQMREVDRAMIDDFRIELIQMMENAGRNLAHLARSRFLNGIPHQKSITIFCGTGGNGGGGLVCARRLHNWGASVQVITTKMDTHYKGVPAHQLDILRRMKVPILHTEGATELQPSDLHIDAVIGYSLKGSPRGNAAKIIRFMNSNTVPVLSLDVPSGIDTTTGEVHQPSVRATATMTLALPKKGLKAPHVLPLIGELYLADISVPPSLYGGPDLGLNMGPVFSEEEIIRLF